jgi:hypothetical protein
MPENSKSSISIYLDHSATTPVDTIVLEAMLLYEFNKRRSFLKAPVGMGNF